MLGELPVFGVCGYSGSGKTTLIESVLPRLQAKGLTVAVIKHDVHGLDVDRPGKDSDRFFQAGADVFLQGPGEEFFRGHGREQVKLPFTLRSLIRRYDMLLVEGYKHTAVPKVWLGDAKNIAPPADLKLVRAVLPWDSDRADTLMSILDDWLGPRWLGTPVFGCVLVDEKEGVGISERTIKLLQEATDRVVIAGDSNMPEVSGCQVHLPAVADLKGPMAGLLAAMRWAPHVSWIVAAGEPSELSADGLRWLLDTRAPGVWATLPKWEGLRSTQPLLAHFDFRSHFLLEQLALERVSDPAKLADHPKVITPSP